MFLLRLWNVNMVIWAILDETPLFRYRLVKMFEGNEGDKKEINNTFVCEKVDLIEMIKADY